MNSNINYYFLVASAILSGSIFGIIGKFSPVYITAVISGQALGGIFTAFVQILSLALGESSVHSAFVYFMVGNVVCFVTFISYIILSKSVYFNFYLNLDNEKSSINADVETTISYKQILKKIWLYGISEWFVFVVTLSIYPGVTVLIESDKKGLGSLWAGIKVCSFYFDSRLLIICFFQIYILFLLLAT